MDVISQSGYITKRLIEYAYSLVIGTDKAVSAGKETTLNSLDFLEFMDQDDSIRVIALYIENMREGRRFFDLARKISKRKPIIAWKGGKTDVGGAQQPNFGLKGHTIFYIYMVDSEIL